MLGREKHIYSVYRKMRGKRLPLEQVLDVYGIRILVDSVDMCYRVLGSVHNLYKPRPGRFKDYIAIPKANGYQSLHTVLFGPRGLPIEVQIRSDEMHEIAESGIAAHVLYKDGNAHDSVAHRRARNWMREILEMQKTAGDPVEFIEHVKVDLFPDTVFVFTPAGEILELARGATPVDFAYAVHTDIGNTCEAARVDGRPASLRTPLTTGQTVEIVTSRRARPDPTWINFVVTGKARANIRGYLKRLHRDEAIDLGRRLLDQALRREDLSLRKLPKGRRWDILEGIPSRQPRRALRRHRSRPAGADPGGETPRGDGPGPGDDGEGRGPRQRRRRGRDPDLHRRHRGDGGQPREVLPAHPRRPHRRLSQLRAGPGRPYRDLRKPSGPRFQARGHRRRLGAEGRAAVPVDIRVEAENRKGVLATIAAAISGLDVNIDAVGIVDRDGINSRMAFTIEVSGRTHLAQVFRRLRAVPLVRRIVRHA